MATDITTDPSRRARDQAIYDFVRTGQKAQAAVDQLTTPPAVPSRTERMRALAKMERRPAITPKRVLQLVALANAVRPRAKAKGSMYAFPPREGAAIRAAIEFIDELEAWDRRVH